MTRKSLATKNSKTTKESFASKNTKTLRMLFEIQQHGPQGMS
jgi:hypothetical protein